MLMGGKYEEYTKNVANPVIKFMEAVSSSTKFF
jgi:hypothetical protein